MDSLVAVFCLDLNAVAIERPGGHGDRFESCDLGAASLLEQWIVELALVAPLRAHLQRIANQEAFVLRFAVGNEVHGAVMQLDAATSMHDLQAIPRSDLGDCASPLQILQSALVGPLDRLMEFPGVADLENRRFGHGLSAADIPPNHQ